MMAIMPESEPFLDEEWSYSHVGDFGELSIVVDPDNVVRRIRLWENPPGQGSVLIGEAWLSGRVICPVTTDGENRAIADALATIKTVTGVDARVCDG